MRKEDYLHPGQDWILIEVEELDPPYCCMTYSIFPGQNVTRTRRKCKALTRLYARGLHTCRLCGDLIPPYKRTDARYCTEQCRKTAARHRRAERTTGDLKGQQ